MRAILYLMVLFVTAIIIAMPAGAVNGDKADAGDVLNDYFKALQEGDVITIKSLLGGALLNKRLRLLNNPTYPEYLRTTYGKATFAIEKSTILSPNKVSIRTIFDFKKQESLSKEFLLIREPAKSESQFRIHSESISSPTLK